MVKPVITRVSQIQKSNPNVNRPSTDNCRKLDIQMSTMETNNRFVRKIRRQISSDNIGRQHQQQQQ